MINIFFVLPNRSKQHLVHNLVSNHHQIMDEVEATTEYEQDYVVVFLPVAELIMDLNACNTKAGII